MLHVKSQLPTTERFERWVFDEVLPTIRKHGVYATDKVIEEMISNPEYGIRLFSELKNAIDGKLWKWKMQRINGLSAS